MLVQDFIASIQSLCLMEFVKYPIVDWNQKFPKLYKKGNFSLNFTLAHTN